MARPRVRISVRVGLSLDLGLCLGLGMGLGLRLVLGLGQSLCEFLHTKTAYIGVCRQRRKITTNHSRLSPSQGGRRRTAPLTPFRGMTPRQNIAKFKDDKSLLPVLIMIN